MIGGVLPAPARLGAGFDSPGRRVTALCVAVAAIAIDLALSTGPFARSDAGHVWRWLLAGAAVLLLGAVARGRWEALGLSLRLRPSRRFWLIAVLLVAAGAALLMGAFLLYLQSTGGRFAPLGLFRRRADFWPWALRLVVSFPVIEELIYRLVVCVALLPWIGRWGAVMVSGVLFAALHVRYGVPAANNMAAGFLFAWAFVRSENIAVPLVLHAAGNLGLGLIALIQMGR